MRGVSIYLLDVINKNLTGFWMDVDDFLLVVKRYYYIYTSTASYIAGRNVVHRMKKESQKMQWCIIFSSFSVVWSAEYQYSFKVKATQSISALVTFWNSTAWIDLISRWYCTEKSQKGEKEYNMASLLRLLPSKGARVLPSNNSMSMGINVFGKSHNLHNWKSALSTTVVDRFFSSNTKHRNIGISAHIDRWVNDVLCDHSCNDKCESRDLECICWWRKKMNNNWFDMWIGKIEKRPVTMLHHL